jgi:phage tail-like protein
MPTKRDNPYGAFNFLVSLGGAQGDGAEGTIIGGFSDVSGLGMDVNYSEYRNGHKLDDVTLKRGLVGSADLFEWIKTVRNGVADPRSVTVRLLDEARNTVAEWRLTRAQPKKWTGPTLAAKGGGEVAMEELHLVHEGIEYV